MNALRRQLLALRASLWAFPTLIVVLCAGLALGLIRLDEQAQFEDAALVFGGDASAARSVLSTIAGSLVTIAGLTFSITIVVLQLASSQFSPRVLRNFLADRVTQLTAGAFVGIFLYAVIVLRAVRSDDGAATGFVPALSVTVAIGLATVALILLLVFVHHISQLIQVSGIAARISLGTLARVDELHPDRFEAEDDTTELVEEWSRASRPRRLMPNRPGYVQAVHLDEVAAAVDDVAARISIDVAPGDFASLETPLLRAWNVDLDEEQAEAMRLGITVANERDPTQDVAFGLRQLADIALRALSPSLNDPTTAVMCIGYMGSIVGRLAGRALLPRREEDGGAAIVARQRSFAEYLEPFAELVPYAERNQRIVAALDGALAEVSACAVRAGAEGRAEQADELAQLVAGAAR